MSDISTQAGHPTIRHVSRLAGVSIKTVSRMPNNEQYGSAESRPAGDNACRLYRVREASMEETLP